ncbi:MAG: cisplatin damage response ATP-dependent DNA ligase [Hyphomonadaceae bacterium]|nr:cisplatin damage response ATP-dependent DNA ligase [Hyphomonadaceae bacterium]
MESFAALLEHLLLTPQRNGRLSLLTGWLADTPDPDRGWGLAALTGGLSFKHAKAGLVRGLIEDAVDPELFRLSYDFVGDLAETVALLWPVTQGANRSPDLSEVIEGLQTTPPRQMKARLATWLDGLDSTGRWALLKLITGGMRVGVSGRMARQAVADLGKVDVGAVEEVWHAQAPPYAMLFDWLEGRSDGPPARQPGAFRPVMLAHPLDENVLAAISPATHIAEWKWDGIRVQVVSEGGVKRLYTRTGEDISHTFPDVVAGIDFEAVLDGELLVRAANGGVAGFNDLQQRLNRKTVDARKLAAFPAFVRAYDLLATPGRDWREAPLRERRDGLQRVIAQSLSGVFDLSEAVPFNALDALTSLRASPPDPRAEGLMLKRLDSPYLAGRVTGHWWKWKREPMRADCVLVYAQRGHGKRSSLYSDFTFAAWTGEPGEPGRALVPVGKAYFGFTDAELVQLDRFVRENTVERFGPVRAVRAGEDFGFVLEVAFEGLARSTRHKSGLAMRFPRIARLRTDKPAREADTLATLLKLLAED